MPCDDANIINGDGCSSTCYIESNYFCSYDDSRLLDKCNYIIPLTANILLPNDSATFIKIQFNQPVITWTQNLLQYISLSCTISHSSNMVFIANNSIEIYLDYNISFKSAQLTVNFSNLNAFMGAQNQSLQTNMLTQELPNYNYYSLKEQQINSSISSGSNLIGSTSSLIPLFSFFAGYFSGLFWSILSALQFLFYLSLIKIKYPDNFKRVLKQSFQPPFNFIPNFISNYAHNNKIFISIDNIFTKSHFNSILIINNGSIIIFIGCLSIINLLLFLISKCSKKPKINFFSSEQYFQIFLSNAPYLILSIMLSLFQLSYLNWFTSISNNVSYFLLILLIIWIHKRHANLDLDSFILKALYPKFKATDSIFGIIDLSQMIILSLSLIILENKPIVNSILIFAVKSIYLVLLIKYQPSENNILFIINETGNLILTSITTVLALDDKYDWFTEDTRINIGWFSIACVFGNIIIQLLLGIFQMIKKYKSKFQNCVKDKEAKR